MKERIQYLLQKYRTGIIQDTEIDELYSLISEQQGAGGNLWDEEELETMIAKIKPEIGQSKIKRLKFLRYAACITLLILASTGYYFYSAYETDESLLAKKEQSYDKSPGTFKAFIKGVNSKEYEPLDSSSVAIARFFETKDYAEDTSIWHTLYTPAGTEFKLQLEDGTVLWVNAGSTIQFPRVFAEDKREIHVQGEVLLEVSKENNRPFFVYTEQQQIEVKGTLFHVNSDAKKTVTTLIEGSIWASNKEKQSTLKITPGQSVRAENGMQHLTTVSIDEILAWRDGYFYFENKPLEEVLQKVALWYNVKIDRGDVDTSVKMNGRISKKKTLMEVTKVFSMSTGIQFKLTNNILTLTK